MSPAPLLSLVVFLVPGAFNTQAQTTALSEPSGPDEYTADSMDLVEKEETSTYGKSYIYTNHAGYPISDGERRSLAGGISCHATFVSPWLAITASHCVTTSSAQIMGATATSLVEEILYEKQIGSRAHLLDFNWWYTTSTDAAPFKITGPPSRIEGLRKGTDFTLIKANNRLPESRTKYMQFIPVNTTSPPGHVGTVEVVLPLWTGFVGEDTKASPIFAGFSTGHGTIHFTLTGFSAFPGMSGTPYLWRNPHKDNRWEVLAITSSSSTGMAPWVLREEIRATLAQSNQQELAYRQEGLTVDTSAVSHAALRNAIYRGAVDEIRDFVDLHVDTTQAGEAGKGQGANYLLGKAVKHYIQAKNRGRTEAEIARRLGVVKELVLSGIDISEARMPRKEGPGAPVVHRAVQKDDWRLLETLLDNVTDYDYEKKALVATDVHGNTPVHRLLERQKSRNVIDLILGKAPPAILEIENKEGKLPMEILLEYSDTEYVGKMVASILQRQSSYLPPDGGEASLRAYWCQPLTVHERTTTAMDEILANIDGWAAKADRYKNDRANIVYHGTCG